MVIMYLLHYLFVTFFLLLIFVLFNLIAKKNNLKTEITLLLKGSGISFFICLIVFCIISIIYVFFIKSESSSAEIEFIIFVFNTLMYIFFPLYYLRKRFIKSKD